jgi:Mg-chelatase subunit ChlD
MQRWIALAFSVVVCSPFTAPADELSATLGQPLREVSHAVDVKLKDGVATLRVRRSFANAGSKHEEAVVDVDLPEGAAATGLRIRASGQWFDGQLLEAEKARQLYEELTGMGVHTPRDPALLQWMGTGHLRLQVFPIPPGCAGTVEYTLTAATTYQGGKYRLKYAAGFREPKLALPVLRLFPEAPRTPLQLGRSAVAAGQPLPVGRRAEAERPTTEESSEEDAGDETDDEVTISVAPPRMDAVAARLGRAVAGPGKEIMRLELDAAPQLRPLPRKLSVVFVVDASYSIGEQGIRAQLEVARAFLRHVPDARFELVLFRRHASRLVGELAPAKSFDAQLQLAIAARRLEPGNGSAFDEGLRLAARALQGRRGPRMIVMFSDGLLRPSFRNAMAHRELARSPGTIAHLVIPDHDGELEEERDDEHPLAAVAARSGGVLLHISGVTPERSQKLGPIALGLVRPTRIDGFRIEGLPEGTIEELPPALVEGTGLREMRSLDRAPRQLVLQGKIWARPFRRVVAVSPSFSKVTAALVFGSELHDSLEPEEQMRLARLGHAVSPVTSYLSMEPGVRPSTEGIDRGLLGSMSGGGGGYGLGTLASRGAGRFRKPPDLKELLADGVKRCVAQHRPAAGWVARLDVETTLDEIVDVTLRDHETPLRRCLVEEIWKVRLGPQFDEEAASFELVLP